MGEARYRRVLVKLSGEVLAPKGGTGFSRESVEKVSLELQDAIGLGVELGVVIGAGNMVRGGKIVSELEIDRVSADHMGILATLINTILLSKILESRGALTG